MKSTRRTFFLRGGAVLGAGAMSSAVSATPQNLAADREAIRRLQLRYMNGSERPSIAGRLESSLSHGGYRLSASEQLDNIEIAADGRHASATFLVETEVCTPIEGDCTAAQMARLQGNVASRHWESGRFDATYVKIDREWKIDTLTYRPVG